MKIVIFGVGRFYQERKNQFPAETEIIAFLDNNPSLQGQSMDGCPVVAPENVRELFYDKIILMSASVEAMKRQLIQLGVDRKNIWYWEYFTSKLCCGKFKYYFGNRDIKNYKKRILIVSSHLDYTGGPFTAVYAARALQDRGYAVFLAAPSGDKAFIDEAVESGINVVLCPALPYIHRKERVWLRQFDAVLVNVFPMIPSACEISRIRPVLWWIHESEVHLYDNIINRFDDYAKREQLKRIHICAVSRVAQNKFNFYFSGRIKELLPYGIPDQKKKNSFHNIDSPLVFAIIGMVHPGKAQDIFLKAVEQLHAEKKRNVQFLVIGPIVRDAYGSQIREEASKEPAVKVTGRLTRSEIHKTYEEIDVIVCPSLEDSLPIVVTEGMMYGKVCIVSDTAGTAEFIEDGKNGLICKAGDPKDLCEKMSWIISNREKLPAMGSEARKVYEKQFAMDSFGQRLERALEETIDSFHREAL